MIYLDTSVALAHFLAESGQAIRIATYDERLIDASAAIGLRAFAP